MGTVPFTLHFCRVSPEFRNSQGGKFMQRKTLILTIFIFSVFLFNQAYSNESDNKEMHMQPSQAPVSIRYIVDDVNKAVDFYTKELGFTLEGKPAPAPGAPESSAPAFAAVTRGSLRLLLSGPGSSGARPMPDGAKPIAGGWNRIQVPVSDIAVEVNRLRQAGYHFRNDILKGVGGSQIILDDPFGNPIELWQAAGK
jgi:catechol 2,3-dioxygenase-like lactoylglutathione lyase family enzyme